MAQAPARTKSPTAGLTAPAWRRGVVLVFALAVSARAALMGYADAHPERFDYPDSRRYALVASHWARGDGPIESPANRTGTDPFYPLLLSPGYLRGGATLDDAYEWGRIVNAGLGLVALAAVMGIARRLAGDVAALAAGLMFALDPVLLFFHGLVLTEIPFTALLWSAIYLLLRSRARPGPIGAVIAGGFLGAAALTRGSALPLALALPWMMCVGGSAPLWRRLTVAAFASAATLMTLYPAAARYHRLIGTWMPVCTGGGATLLDSFGPWANGGTGWERIVWPTVPAGADEAQRDRIYRDAAWSWAAAHPAESAKLAWAKFKRTWSVTMNAPGYTTWTYAAIGWLTVAPVYLLALGGLWRMRRSREALLVLLTPALYFTLVHVIFIGSVRYRVPAMPGLFVLAAAALAPWIERRIAARPGATRIMASASAESA